MVNYTMLVYCHSIAYMLFLLLMVTGKSFPLSYYTAGPRTMCVYLRYRHQRLDDGKPTASLNPTKTRVMWLGSSQQLDKIGIREVPLLSTRVTVVDTARDLGNAHVTAVCRSGYCQLRH